MATKAKAQDKPAATATQEGAQTDEQRAQAEAEAKASAKGKAGAVSVTEAQLAEGLHAIGCGAAQAGPHKLDSHAGRIVRGYRDQAAALFSAVQ